MATLDKLLARMPRNPVAVRFDDAARALRAAGFVEANVTGSYHRFRHRLEQVDVVIVRPHGREPYLRRHEVRKLLAVIEEVSTS